MEKWHHAEAAEERSFFGEEIARNARGAMWDGRPRPSWSAPVPLKEVASATMNFAIFAHWLTKRSFIGMASALLQRNDCSTLFRWSSVADVLNLFREEEGNSHGVHDGLGAAKSRQTLRLDLSHAE
jgi:hypothetical protein